VMTKLPYSDVDGEKTGSGTELEPGHKYCEVVGSLLYLANTVRPDISHAVGALSRYREKPTTSHWNAAMRVVKYLLSTKDHGLRLGGSDVPLIGYVDASFASDLDSRKSTTGYVFKVFGGAVSWGSKKQQAVTTSTVEAEYMAASTAIKEASWLKGLLNELEIDTQVVPLKCDNLGCIQNLKNSVNSSYTKHISVAFHFAREHILTHSIELDHVSSGDNVADVFTKALPYVTFARHRESLGVMARQV
jgi:hypothetical protein